MVVAHHEQDALASQLALQQLAGDLQYGFFQFGIGQVFRADKKLCGTGTALKHDVSLLFWFFIEESTALMPGGPVFLRGYRAVRLAGVARVANNVRPAGGGKRPQNRWQSRANHCRRVLPASRPGLVVLARRRPRALAGGWP